MIRRAKLPDLPTLIQLENVCFTTDRISARNMRRLLQTNSAEILVAEDQNLVIAVAVLLFRKNSKTARIYSLAVAPHYRQKGIANKLCEAMEKSAIKRYSEYIALEVHPENQAAIRFYEKIGYHQFGKLPNFYECGSDAIRMKKRVTQSWPEK